MKRKSDLIKSIYVGLSLALAAMTAHGDIEDNLSIKSLQVKNDTTVEKPMADQISMERLATDALVDTDSKFEAILYDDQSQVTLGHLYWNQDDGKGKILFEYGEKKQQIDLQIPNAEWKTFSERYQTLLRGLHEAGIAWLSQGKSEVLSMRSNSVQQPSLRHKPTGHFDTLVPGDLFRLTPPVNFNRTASGWSYDPDAPATNNWVHIYARILDPFHPFNDPLVYSKAVLVAATLANLPRPDVNKAFNIKGNHGWSAIIPEAWDADGYRDNTDTCWKSGKQGGTQWQRCELEFTAYGINVLGNDRNNLLHNSFKRISFEAIYPTNF